MAANALDDVTFAYLLSLCASKRVQAVIGGPPCRTVSALRFQNDQGPPILRTEEHPWGLPSLTPQQAEIVTNDSILWLRLLLMYMLCEEVRPTELPQTAFLCEQPRDPAEYRNERMFRSMDTSQCGELWNGEAFNELMVPR